MKGTRVWLVLFGILLLNPLLLQADEELMKKYEPFLFFHKEDVYKELFYPMDVEKYVGRCSLWYDDKKESDEGAMNLGLLANVGKTREDSDKLYLKFVEKYTPWALFPLKPKVSFWDYTLDALNEYINASPKYTYHFRQFIEPDYGYLVLQFWFFYAFNQWGAYPFGWNVHEGDWESITLFLHPVTRNPVYAAYSAHHDKEDKVRKGWDEIKKTGTHPRVFVALGSHANYFEPKFDILTEILTGEKPALDRANGSGMIIGPLKMEGASDWGVWENRVILEDESHSLPDWAKFYKGKWGMDAVMNKPGFDGPRFPPFQSNSDIWYHPAKWAGIKEAPLPVTKAKIEIEDADSVWETGLTPSESLAVVAKTVSPRIIVEYADSCFNWNFTGSEELNKAAKIVSPRIIVEYADLSSHQNLQKSESIENIAKTVSPRIIVEYADSSRHQNLEKSEALEKVARIVSPRIIVEYADSTFSRNLSRFSAGGVEPVAERTLSITSAETSPGTSTAVHLSITDASGIAGGDILIKYDMGIITVSEVKGTDLISGISLAVNKDKPGEIKISMAGTKGIPSGSGALVDIGLKINDSAKAGTQTTLEISDTKIYDESGNTIPISLKNGIVKIIEPVGIKGDVNNDGKIGSDDAILTLRITAGLMVPTEYQKWAADVNGDGKVGADDAIRILRIAAGLPAPGRDIIASINRQITIVLAEAHGVAGESVTVPLKVDSINGLAGGCICIAYNSSVLRAVDVSFEDMKQPGQVLASGTLFASNVAEPGLVRIAFVSTDRLNSETLAKIRFDVLADDVSPLTLRSVDLYQPDALPIDARKLDGKFVSWAIPPKRSALLQNFPNPLNPDTWIPYQLKEGGEVTIQIFSVLGDLVRELRLGYKPAGLYVSKDRAAYWDGTNEHGEKVASGVYFYSIKAGNFFAARKLTVLK